MCERAHKVVIMSGVECANEMRDKLAKLFRAFGDRCLVFVLSVCCLQLCSVCACVVLWLYMLAVPRIARPKLD